MNSITAAYTHVHQLVAVYSPTRLELLVPSWYSELLVGLGYTLHSELLIASAEPGIASDSTAVRGATLLRT